MVNRQRRTVQSFVDNVPRAQQEDPQVAAVIARFRDLDLDHAGPADLELLRREVAPLIDRPKPFGRFQGFNDDSLEALIRRHVPELRAYGEIVCPLWGLLPRFAGAGIETWFLKDENRAFWGPGCCNEDGQSCFDYAREVLGVDHVTTLSAMIERGERLDVLGILNFLDHLASPLELLRRARSVADTLLIVLVPDFPGGPGVIQHHTSFDRSVVTRLAREVGLGLAETVPCGDSPEPEFFAYLLA